jgi:hypothetical protein
MRFGGGRGDGRSWARAGGWGRPTFGPTSNGRTTAGIESRDGELDLAAVVLHTASGPAYLRPARVVGVFGQWDKQIADVIREDDGR